MEYTKLMNNAVNYLIIILLIFVMIRLIIEYIRYKKSNHSIKAQISYRAYPFLIITNILFIILVLIEMSLRLGLFIK